MYYIAKSSYREMWYWEVNEKKNEIKLSFNQDWDGLLMIKLFKNIRIRLKKRKVKSHKFHILWCKNALCTKDDDCIYYRALYFLVWPS